nr:hypothetical protein L7610.10 - Leishmania major [Leishmania major]
MQRSGKQIMAGLRCQRVQHMCIVSCTLQYCARCGEWAREVEGGWGSSTEDVHPLLLPPPSPPPPPTPAHRRLCSLLSLLLIHTHPHITYVHTSTRNHLSLCVFLSGKDATSVRRAPSPPPSPPSLHPSRLCYGRRCRSAASHLAEAGRKGQIARERRKKGTGRRDGPSPPSCACFSFVLSVAETTLPPMRSPSAPPLLLSPPPPPSSTPPSQLASLQRGGLVAHGRGEGQLQKEPCRVTTEAAPTVIPSPHVAFPPTSPILRTRGLRARAYARAIGVHTTHTHRPTQRAEAYCQTPSLPLPLPPHSEGRIDSCLFLTSTV